MSVDRSLSQALNATVEGLRQASAEQAVATFTARTELAGGLQTKASIRQFDLVVDEPQALGGTDQGPNPVELVLAALGTCQEIVYAAYAAVLGIPLDGVHIKVRGTLDPRGLFGVAEVAPGFLEVFYDVEIASPAPEADIVRLREIVDAHCPVLDILRRAQTTRSTLALNNRLLTSAY